MIDIEDLVKVDRKLTNLHRKPADWANELRSAVTMGFLRRPWNAEIAVQTIDDLIEVLDAAAALTVGVSTEHGWLGGTLGVVTTTCSWPELGDDDVQVIRVFTKRAGQWLCEYWQETRYHRHRI